MPGVDLALGLPSLADPMATIVSKLVTAVSAIADDLAGLINPSEMDINASLSMAGNSLTEIGSLQLLAGNVPTAAGALWYQSGELYFRDTTGVIQITSNGSLNTAAVGTIVGDYGGLNPARVSYDDASGEYRFTEDTGVWADLVADDLVLNSATGSVRFSVDNAITTARQFIIKDIPAAGVGCLVYDSSTSTVEDASNKRVTSTVKATSLDLTGNITMTGGIAHGDYTIYQTPEAAIVTAGTYPGSLAGTIPIFTLSAGGTVLISVKGLRKGDRLKSLKLHAALASGTTEPTVQLRRHIAGSSSLLLGTFTSTLAANETATLTIGSPETISSDGQVYYVFLTAGASALLVYALDHTHDRPAP